jgi:hypothetical protein
MPPWFANLQLEWALAWQYRDDPGAPCCITHFEFLIALLVAYTPAIHRWIDNNLCAGSVVVRETHARFLDICDWSQLPPDHPRADLVAVFKRLQGLAAG